MTDENEDLLDADDDVGDDDGVEVEVEEAVIVSDEAYSLAAKNKVREELARQVEEFIARGGHIDSVGSDISADPPRKPSTSYGSQPI